MPELRTLVSGVAVATLLLSTSTASARPQRPNVEPLRGKSAGDCDIAFSYFVVHLAQPLAAKTIDAMVRSDGRVDALRRCPPGGASLDVDAWCDARLVSERFASWVCGFMAFDSAQSGGAPGGFEIRRRALVISERGAVTGIQLVDLFGRQQGLTAKLAALIDDQELTEGLDYGAFTLGESGIEFWTDVGDPPATILYEDLAPLLVGPVGKALLEAMGLAPAADAPRSDAPPDDPEAAATPVRAPAHPPGAPVPDAGRGLEWAAEDNGYDTNWAGAAAWVAAYRGGGHADWRLPTADELQTLLTPTAANRPADGCEGGTHAYHVSPSLHVTCGLLWAADVKDGRAAALGLISKKSRWSALGETKNLRALAVRSRH